MWINKIQRDITYGDKTIRVCVRGETGMDTFIERGLFRRIYKAVTGAEYGVGADFWSPEVQAINTLVELINRTESIDGIGAWATAESPDNDLKQAYELLSQLPAKIVSEWLKAKDEAELPPGIDIETASPETLKQAIASGKVDGSKKTLNGSKLNEKSLETT